MSNNTDSASTTPYVLYHYEPSIAASSIFLVLFGISTLLHSYQTTLTRSLPTLPLIIGCLCETLGYIGRLLNGLEHPASGADYKLGPYILQSILLLIAPPLIAATVYMTLGRVVLATDGEAYSIVPKKFLTKVFVVGDIFSFLIQSTGAGILAKGEVDAVKAGNWIVIGGLGVQIIFFGAFMVITVLFGMRMQKRPTEMSRLPEVRWRLHLAVLFAVSLLIMVRSVFRVVEYVQGTSGYLLSHEVFLYIFDAVPMFLAVVLFNIWHPTQITALAKGGKMMKNIVFAKRVEKLVIENKSVRPGDEEIALQAPAAGFR